MVWSKPFPAYHAGLSGPKSLLRQELLCQFDDMITPLQWLRTGSPWKESSLAVLHSCVCVLFLSFLLSCLLTVTVLLLPELGFWVVSLGQSLCPLQMNRKSKIINCLHCVPSQPNAEQQFLIMCLQRPCLYSHDSCHHMFKPEMFVSFSNQSRCKEQTNKKNNFLTNFMNFSYGVYF